MTIKQTTYDDTIGHVSWSGAIQALRDGHRLPRAQTADIFLCPGESMLLSRGAYIEGLGNGVKSVTVFDGNPEYGLPTVQGAMLVFEPQHGQLEGMIESRLINRDQDGLGFGARRDPVGTR